MTSAATPRIDANLAPRTLFGDRVLLALLLATLLVRAAALAAFPHALSADPDGYRELARNVVERGVFGYLRPTGDGSEVCLPTAWRPPLYPLSLVPAELFPDDRWPIRAWHLALGVATTLGVVLVGRLQGLGGYALAAGALVALDPILLVQSTLVMTETLAAALAVLGLYTLARLDEAETRAKEERSGRSHAPGRWAFATGIALGLAALCRPTFLLWAGLALAGRGIVGPTPAARVRAIALGGLGLTLALAPWAIRNAVQLGTPVVATTHGGFTRWLANNPRYFAHVQTRPWSEPWDGRLPPLSIERAPDESIEEAGPGGPAEVARDRAYDAAAARAIAADPAGARWATAHRLAKFWAVAPHADSPAEGPKRRLARYAVGVWYSLQFALAAIGVAVILSGRAPAGTTRWLPTLLLVATFAYAHSIYWSDLRMRGPIEPALALVAALGLRTLVARAASGGRKTTPPEDGRRESGSGGDSDSKSDA